MWLQDLKKAKVTRKFILVEGLYASYGDICPLPKLVSKQFNIASRLNVNSRFMRSYSLRIYFL